MEKKLLRLTLLMLSAINVSFAAQLPSDPYVGESDNNYTPYQADESFTYGNELFDYSYMETDNPFFATIANDPVWSDDCDAYTPGLVCTTCIGVSNDCDSYELCINTVTCTDPNCSYHKSPALPAPHNLYFLLLLAGLYAGKKFQKNYLLKEKYT